MRGCTVMSDMTDFNNETLSPRMRGCTVCGPGLLHAMASYPRVCGGVPRDEAELDALVTLSPRMRGCTGLQVGAGRQQGRLSPRMRGCTAGHLGDWGKSFRYPRVCGGVPRRVDVLVLRITVIPAYAGVYRPCA